MKTLNKIIVYVLISIVVVSSTFQFAFIKSHAVDSSTSYILDSVTEEIFSDSFNSSYNEYVSPELFVYGIDQVYQDINNNLYDKYGWDVETLTFEDLGWDFSSNPSPAIQAANDMVLGNDLQDYINNSAYTWLKAKLPIAGTAIKDAWCYVFGAVSSGIQGVADSITDLYPNLVIPWTRSLSDKVIESVEDVIIDSNLTDLSSMNVVYVPPNTGFKFYCYDSQHELQRYYVYYCETDMFVYCTSGIFHVIVPEAAFYSDGNQTGAMKVKGTGQRYNIDGTLYSSFSNWQIGSGHGAYTRREIDHNIWYDGRVTALENFYYLYDFSSAVDIIQYIDTLDGATVSGRPYSYRWGANERLKELLDSLEGNYVTTNQMTAIIDVLDDVQPVPYPREEEGVISDSLPLLLPDDEVLEDVQDIIDEVIAWNEAISDIVEDVPIDDAIDVPVPPGPINPFPDIPPTVPEWVVPPFLPDIFNGSGAFDIFKPIFDIVGTTYSMDSTWVLIPSILIFILILYMIVSVL